MGALLAVALVCGCTWTALQYFSVENKEVAATSKELLKTMLNIVADGVSI
ncbi:hypothetical protein HNV12_09625 [Methanococcoides sp. SA1]|nr:hypothetical protein [Methanococcoides sp. SA1]